MKKTSQIKNTIHDNYNIQTSFLTGIFLAKVIGIILSSIILLFSKNIIKTLYNIDNVNNNFLDSTSNYFVIRSLSLPCVLINYIIFGFSIAMGDIYGPLYSIIISFVVNMLGDYYLVGVKFMGSEGVYRILCI